MREQLFRVLILVGVLAAGTTAAAHHAFVAEFDPEKPVSLKGEVIKMQWINPHGWLHIAVERPEGKTEEWMIETGAPNALLRRGFTKDSLPAGTVVTVEGHQARDGSLRANGWELKLEDGSVLFLGSSGTGSPYETKRPPSRQQQ